MAFPSVVYGNYGDEKVTSTSKIGGLPLGTEMQLPDGRKFHHIKNGGVALVAGKLYQGPDVEANTILHKSLLVPNSATVGATQVLVTMAGTILSADVFAEGYLVTSSSIGTGIGYTYKIKSQTAATAATDTITVKLDQSDAVKVALEAGTTKVGMRKSPYDGALLTTGNTVGVNTLLGVACATAAASTFAWLQRRGLVGVFTDNTTPVIGLPVMASSTVAGAIGLAAGTVVASVGWAPIGICVSPAASAQFTLVDLTLE